MNKHQIKHLPTHLYERCTDDKERKDLKKIDDAISYLIERLEEGCKKDVIIHHWDTDKGRESLTFSLMNERIRQPSVSG